MTDFARSLALLIGIDAYGSGIPRLTTAVNDAARLAGLLADAHGYETVLLTQPATGQPVTRERLRTLFTQELPARLGDDDRLLVYFAGHGVALDGDDGPRGYLVPQDARPGDSTSMLAMTDLHAWLTALPCRHMLAILDCCFAGAFRWAATRHIGALPDVIHQERYDRYLRSPAWQVLTSAAYDQKALDVLNGKAIGVRESDGKGHSPFAQALIDALEKGEADLVPKGQGDGVITATELYLYLREQVEVKAEEQASHEQTPGLWPLNKHRKGEFIFLAPGHPLNLPPAPDLTEEANPYRGLKSYDQQHAPLFFGREDEIGELVQRVEEKPFLAVLGASGTGKSSLVKAGLLPRLAARSDDFSRHVPAGATEVATTNAANRVLPPMRPTDRPVRALEMLLHAELGEDPSGVEDPSGFPNPKGLDDDIEDPSGFPNPKGLDDDALAAVITRWAATHPGQRLVLTIDQFEELATLCRDDGERARFLRLLANAVQAQPDVLRLILTLRTDFEPQFTQEGSPLAAVWNSGRTVVPPMDIEDLRQVIEGPASVRVLYFDPPELVDDLIKEVIQTPGALPLLSFTLSELYVKYVQSGRDDRALAGADYQALGGVVGSLRNRATEECDALPDDTHRTTMQRAMLRMVAVEGGELARRRVALSELEYPTTEENARVQVVLDRLVDARLLVRGTSDPSAGSGQALDGTQGEAYVEPAHDALVLAWDKLLRWKQEAEEYLPLQRRLAQAAGEWSKAAPDAKTGLLWDDDPRLPQVEETLWPTGGKKKGLAGRFRWVKQVLAPKTNAPADTKWLNGAELSFIQTSVTHRASALRRVIGITAAVMIALAGLTIFASYQANQATLQRNEANVQRDNAINAGATAVAEGNARATEVVVRSTAEANAERSAQAEATAAADARQKQAKAEREAAIARSRQLAALSSKDLADNQYETAMLLAIEAGRATANLGTGVQEAFDAIRASTAHPGRSTRVFYGQSGSMAQLTWSHDESKILTRSTDGTVRIWDAATGAVLVRLEDVLEDVDEATWSQDEAKILTSGGGIVRIWDAVTGTELVKLQDVYEATWSQDESKVITRNIEGTIVRIWDATTGVELVSLEGHTGSVYETKLSKDQLKVFTGALDGTVRIWDVTTGAELIRLEHQGLFAQPTWSQNEGKVLTAAHIWDAVTGAELVSFEGAYSSTWSQDESKVLTLSSDGTIRIWDAVTGAELIRLQGHSEPIVCGNCNHATWSLDETKVLSRNQDNTVRIWDASTGAELVVLEGVDNSTWSHDESKILTRTTDGTVRIWDAATGTELVRLKYLAGLDVKAAWSRDQSKVLTSADDTVRIWDAATGTELVRLEGVTGPMWSQDETKILTHSHDGAARIWDITTSSEPVKLGDHIGGLTQAMWSRDETKIFTRSKYGTARVWDAATGVELGELEAKIDDVNQTTWSQDGAKILTSSRDRTARIWDAATGAELVRLEGHTGSVNQATWSRDESKILTSSTDGTVRIWDAATGAELVRLEGHTGSVGAAWSQDETKVLTSGADSTIRIWDAATGKELVVLTGHTDWVEQVTWSRDGSKILTSSADRTARIWDAATGNELVVLTGHTGPVYQATWSRDESRVLTRSQDGSARIWDAAAGTELVRLEGVTDPMWSQDEAKILTHHSHDGAARIWDAATGAELVRLEGHTGWVNQATWSQDGSKVLTSSADGTVRIWDAATGAELDRLEGHTGSVNQATWSRDEAKVLTLGDDGTVRIWIVRMADLVVAACRRASRNFTWDEWNRWIKGNYRPTCVEAPLPPDAIAAIQAQVAAQARAGNVITATATLDQLNGWLRENGQFSAFGKDVESWSALCWYGAAWNEAALVLDACETAVKLAPKDGHARDGRGLARALTDDVSGAIEDFEFAVQGWTEAGADASLIASRTAWIAALQASKAPAEIFDAATLEKLRAE